MSVFLLKWTLGSSFCYTAANIVVVIFIKKTKEAKLKLIVPISIVLYWSLLGLVQLLILKPYISCFFYWGLCTIFGGIVSSGLLASSCSIIAKYLFRKFSFIFPGRTGQGNRFEVALIALIICLFGSGFLLGCCQSLILNLEELPSSYLQIPLITGILWNLSFPAYSALLFPYIIILTIIKEKPFIYVSVVFVVAIITNLLKGFLLGKILFS